MSEARPKNLDLRGLLILKLQTLFYTENHLIKALPKMAKKARNEKLRAAFEKHLAETEVQAERLAQIFEQLGEKPKKLTSEAIRGLIEDAEWVGKNIKGNALDAALIAAAQYVEHYEMAGYGTAAEWAENLGETEVKNLLGQTLEEEKITDETLSELAKSAVNMQA